MFGLQDELLGEWRAATARPARDPTMGDGGPGRSSAAAAGAAGRRLLGRRRRARVVLARPRRGAAGRGPARRQAPAGACSTTRRATSTPRCCCGCCARSRAIVLVTRWSATPSAAPGGPPSLTAIARDAGGLLRGDRRRPAHPGPPARRAGRAAAPPAPLGVGHPDPRPAAAAADPGRQRDHPGQGLPRGPVLHRDRAARARRPRRGLGGHRVRRAQDDPLGLRARRHDRRAR